MKNNRDQVAVSSLVFTHNWEDPASDEAALQIKQRDRILAITSGGCNVLGFLLADPAIIYSVDINPAQARLLELKIAAIKTLDYAEFAEFSGLRPSMHRLRLYDRVSRLLDSDAKAFWSMHRKCIYKGFIMQGKYEGFIRMAGRFIGLLQGRKRVAGLFNASTQTGQEIYFDQVWDTKRFHLLFKLLFNKKLLARRGLVSDYFHFDDGSKSFSESFYNRSKKAFRSLPVKGNYFLSLYLLGRYRNEEELPAYLLAENFELIKSRVDRIQIICSDAQTWLDNMPSESIDCFALSNICELMSEPETGRLFTAVANAASPGARAIFRNLMIPRDVPAALKNCIVKDNFLSQKIFNNDRSFVYGKVAAYNILKNV